eukprot:9702574-Karenia_brevis.AAC.1
MMRPLRGASSGSIGTSSFNCFQQPCIIASLICSSARGSLNSLSLSKYFRSNVYVADGVPHAAKITPRTTTMCVHV